MVPLGNEKALFIPQTTIYQPGPTLPVGSPAQTLPGLRQSSLPTSEDNALRFVLITWPRADKPSLPKAVSKRSTLTCPPTRKEQALKKFNLFLAAHLVDLLSIVGRGGELACHTRRNYENPKEKSGNSSDGSSRPHSWEGTSSRRHRKKSPLRVSQLDHFSGFPNHSHYFGA